MKTLFGPVPSRRLGRSLGIDVIPPKTCTYDCVYCESGPTTLSTVTRSDFIAPDTVIHELEEYFALHPQGTEALTFSSAGEPTLYEPLGELLRSIKKRFRALPLVVLTNGSLLWDPKVREDLLAADRVVPSLDAVTQAAFQRVNRPHPALKLEAILEGLKAFRREYHGQLHIEVLLVLGLNDAPDHLREIARIIEGITPEAVEMNTVVRPPAEPGILGLSATEMETAAACFPRSKTTIIGRFQADAVPGHKAELSKRIMELVRRRPCGVWEMSNALGVGMDELNEALAKLREDRQIIMTPYNETEFVCVP